MSPPNLYPVLGAVVTAVKARATATGSPLRLYERSKAPTAPQAPYVIADLVNSGYGWDAGLGSTPTCVWVGIQFTGVGRTDVDALWALDQARTLLFQVDVTTVTASGVAVRSFVAEDPPSTPFEAGDLVNAAETVLVYVEAV